MKIHVRMPPTRRVFSPETLRLLSIVANFYEERTRAMILLMLAFKKGCSNVREGNSVRSGFVMGQRSTYNRRGVESRGLPLPKLLTALSSSARRRGVPDPSVVLFRPRTAVR